MTNSNQSSQNDLHYPLEQLNKQAMSDGPLRDDRGKHEKTPLWRKPQAKLIGMTNYIHQFLKSLLMSWLQW